MYSHCVDILARETDIKVFVALNRSDRRKKLILLSTEYAGLILLEFILIEITRFSQEKLKTRMEFVFMICGLFLLKSYLVKINHWLIWSFIFLKIIGLCMLRVSSALWSCFIS